MRLTKHRPHAVSCRTTKALLMCERCRLGKHRECLGGPLTGTTDSFGLPMQRERCDCWCINEGLHAARTGRTERRILSALAEGGRATDAVLDLLLMVKKVHEQ